jgi:DNA polymerase-1
VIIGVDGTNWVSSLWHTVGDRAPVLAAERLSAVVDHALGLSATPVRVVVCWDRRSFRHDANPEYKAGRKAKDPGWVRAIEEGPKHLGVEGNSLAVDGYEADDLLASMAAAAVAVGEQCILCTMDKDCYQCLVAGQVSVLRNFKTDHVTVDDSRYIRLYKPQWITEACLLTETGLRAAQWIDYQCLVGESGDNVAGCPGWGPKTATEHLQKCGSIERLFAMLTPGAAEYNPWAVPGYNAKKVPAKHRALLAWKPHYPATRRLIELRTDVWEVWDALR